MLYTHFDCKGISTLNPHVVKDQLYIPESVLDHWRGLGGYRGNIQATYEELKNYILLIVLQACKCSFLYSQVIVKLSQVVNPKSGTKNNREKRYQKANAWQASLQEISRSLNSSLKILPEAENQRIFLLLRPWANLNLGVIHWLPPPLLFSSLNQKALRTRHNEMTPSSLNNFWKAQLFSDVSKSGGCISNQHL